MQRIDTYELWSSARAPTNSVRFPLHRCCVYFKNWKSATSFYYAYVSNHRINKKEKTPTLGCSAGSALAVFFISYHRSCVSRCTAKRRIISVPYLCLQYIFASPLFRKKRFYLTFCDSIIARFVRLYNIFESVPFILIRAGRALSKKLFLLSSLFSRFCVFYDSRANIHYYIDGACGRATMKHNLCDDFISIRNFVPWTQHKEKAEV